MLAMRFSKMYISRHLFRYGHSFICKFVCLVPVWPHAGGLGLCEMVQHISIFDYISVSPTLKNK